MNITLVSIDENEFQPLGVAGPAAYLIDAGYSVSIFDQTKEIIDVDSINASSDIVGISVPIFAAIEGARKLANDLIKQGYSKKIIFYNQYATVQPETFFINSQCYVVMGEFEESILQFVKVVESKGHLDEIHNIWNGDDKIPDALYKRSYFLAPYRAGLPDLGKYAKLKNNIVIGNVETMRGCARACTYCSVFAAYNKRVVKIPEDIVLEDIRELVRLGAGHITFIDADHFSTGKRGIEIIRKMKERHPWVTFDITARLDDIIRYKEIVKEMKDLGCTEITTAVEFPKQNVLDNFHKDITMQQTIEALRYCQDISLKIKPTFVTYTPWVDVKDMDLFDQFIIDEGLEGFLDPLQRETRLLLYKGSPLLAGNMFKNIKLVEHDTFFDWVHPISDVDKHYEDNVTPEADGRKKRCCVKG